jgi:hypothetical protein
MPIITTPDFLGKVNQWENLPRKWLSQIAQRGQK